MFDSDNSLKQTSSGLLIPMYAAIGLEDSDICFCVCRHTANWYTKHCTFLYILYLATLLLYLHGMCMKKVGQLIFYFFISIIHHSKHCCTQDIHDAYPVRDEWLPLYICIWLLIKFGVLYRNGLQLCSLCRCMFHSVVLIRLCIDICYRYLSSHKMWNINDNKLSLHI